MNKERFLMSHKVLAWLLSIGLVLSLLPMAWLAAYNHPYYDDFGFSIRTHAAWRDTGSVVKTVEAAVENTLAIRHTWEGTYATSFISALQPGLFGEGHYWIATAALLGGLLIALWFFLWEALRLIGAGVAAKIAVFCALAFVIVQFQPSVSEAFYWFNGGVAYTLLWSVMLGTAALWLRFDRCKSRAGRVWLFVPLALLCALVGGAKYSTVLFAVLLAACHTGYAFWKKRPGRIAYPVLLAVLVGGFVVSMTAPGNAVRAETLQGGMSAFKAVLQSLYFGAGLIGNWFSLPLAAAIALAVAVLWPSLTRCKLRFAHPVWVTLGCYALFCAQLTPTIYTGNYLGDGRTLNTYYDSYVLMTCLLALYWAGFVARRREGLPERKTERINGGLLCVLAVMLMVGCVAYHPDGSESYGPQNMAAGSALRSVLSGEAAHYDTQMTQREQMLNDPELAKVELSLLDSVPKAFMGDPLQSGQLGYVLSLYEEYYNKAEVRLGTGEE